MENEELSAPTSRTVQRIMAAACAGFEHDCRQARKGLRVSMAVNVFGMGTLIPNNLADDVEDANTTQPGENHASFSLEATGFLGRAAAA
ncbi:hypothetical protein [Pseudomonas sp. FP198]|uniref:hypothetical protein n=1 Tax=Pseudomonas sp. FP198 TaxID=2954084 RepID=UPI002735011D|nr:hypothetical protein [Pseudomonas sp. FP198]WLG93849.1 hypothetical protein PSH78_15690 [Pseudomonas sp. FP198]